MESRLTLITSDEGSMIWTIIGPYSESQYLSLGIGSFVDMTMISSGNLNEAKSPMRTLTIHEVVAPNALRYYTILIHPPRSDQSHWGEMYLNSLVKDYAAPAGSIVEVINASVIPEEVVDFLLNMISRDREDRQ